MINLFLFSLALIKKSELDVSVNIYSRRLML